MTDERTQSGFDTNDGCEHDYRFGERRVERIPLHRRDPLSSHAYRAVVTAVCRRCGSVVETETTHAH